MSKEEEPEGWASRERKARDAMDDLRKLIEEQAEIRHRALMEGIAEENGSYAAVAKRIGVCRQAVQRNVQRYGHKYGTVAED